MFGRPGCPLDYLDRSTRCAFICANFARIWAFFSIRYYQGQFMKFEELEALPAF
jgi:hypothetical protein